MNSYPLQNSCLENSMDRGDWRATVDGVIKSQTRLSDCTATITKRGRGAGGDGDVTHGWKHPLPLGRAVFM